MYVPSSFSKARPWPLAFDIFKKNLYWRSIKIVRAKLWNKMPSEEEITRFHDPHLSIEGENFVRKYQSTCTILHKLCGSRSGSRSRSGHTGARIPGSPSSWAPSPDRCSARALSRPLTRRGTCIQSYITVHASL